MSIIRWLIDHLLGTDGPSDLVTIVDEHGQQLQVLRQDWVDNAVLPNVRKHWSSPDDLYQSLCLAIQNEAFRDVVDAAAHLSEIDGQSRRALMLQGHILQQAGLLDEAERVLSRALDRHGPDAPALTHLARIADTRREPARRDALLEQAIAADPNHCPALEWWVDLHGPGNLDRLAALPGSWFAQCLIARRLWAAGDRAGAVALYEQAAAAGADSSDALTTISCDLGSAGAPADAIRLVAPRYDPDRHDLDPGINLVHAFRETKRLPEARAMLARIEAAAEMPLSTLRDQIAAAERSALRS